MSTFGIDLSKWQPLYDLTSPFKIPKINAECTVSPTLHIVMQRREHMKFRLSRRWSLLRFWPVASGLFFGSAMPSVILQKTYF